MPDERYERGMLVRRAVLGEEHVDRAQANAREDFPAPESPQSITP